MRRLKSKAGRPPTNNRQIASQMPYCTLKPKRFHRDQPANQRSHGHSTKCPSGNMTPAAPFPGLGAEPVAP